MKAVVYEKYGPPEVFHLKEIEKPEPKDNEILIKIKATAVNAADWRLRKADPFLVRLFFGLFRPKKKILGYVLSGEVEAIGKNVKKFKPGDAVFGSTGLSFGANAEYKCLPENASIAIKPGNTSHEDVAAIPFGTSTALHFLRKANVKTGEKVLIYGASGAVGTAAIQLAKYFGADVTGVCSTGNVDMVRSLGADTVIDYTNEDFSKTGATWDVIFDTVGKMSVNDAARSMNKKGRLVFGSAGPSQMFAGMQVSLTKGIKVISGVANENPEMIQLFKELLESGKLKAVIDRTYPLEDLAAAHRYVEQGHKKGNVVITVV